MRIFNITYPDYHFVTREDMLKDVNAGEFIEHAEFSGNMYGTRSVTIAPSPVVQGLTHSCVLHEDGVGAVCS